MHIGAFGGIVHIDKASSSSSPHKSSIILSSAPGSSSLLSSNPMMEILTTSTQQLSFNATVNNDDKRQCSIDIYICYNCHQQVYDSYVSIFIIFFSDTITTTSAITSSLSTNIVLYDDINHLDNDDIIQLINYISCYSITSSIVHQNYKQIYATTVSFNIYCSLISRLLCY